MCTPSGTHRSEHCQSVTGPVLQSGSGLGLDSTTSQMYSAVLQNKGIAIAQSVHLYKCIKGLCKSEKAKAANIYIYLRIKYYPPTKKGRRSLSLLARQNANHIILLVTFNADSTMIEVWVCFLK